MKAKILRLFADEPAAGWREALQSEGLHVEVCSLAARVDTGDPPALNILDGRHEVARALELCKTLRGHQGDAFTPVLFVTSAGDASARRACLDAGADACLAEPFEPAELLAQVQALRRIKERHDLQFVRAQEAQRLNRRLQSAYQDLDRELDLARRLQESFLPQSLPELPSVRFGVEYRPRGRVGGDFYDAFRLDEKHLGFYVADAMGHGLPAALLTIFVKRGVRAKEIHGQGYRLVPPNEVLARLNRELIDQAIDDVPFITMVYVLYNHLDGTLHFSRAGHPHPLWLPPDGPAEFWQLDGSLLGVFDTEYRLQTQQLRQGDKLILYTDCMDAAAFEDHPVGLPSLIAAAEKYRHLPIDALVRRLSEVLFTQTECPDDLTILGLDFA